MAYSTIKLNDEIGSTYQLPDGVSFETFNWGRTQSILKEGLAGPFENGAAVIDSIDIRTIPKDVAPVEAVRELLIRNGAKPSPTLGGHGS